jgi:adenosylmethionine-8-amino-7-oxononanoate aminotransferase
MKICLDKSVQYRPLGNTIYLLPPYSITSEELEITYQKIINILKQLSNNIF